MATATVVMLLYGLALLGIALNGVYTRATVNYDDEANPYKGWSSAAVFALWAAGPLLLVAIGLSSAGAVFARSAHWRVLFLLLACSMAPVVLLVVKAQ